MNTGFHPTHPVPRTQAAATDGQRLLDEFARNQDRDADKFDWELLAAIAVAKVLELEGTGGVAGGVTSLSLYRDQTRFHRGQQRADSLAAIGERTSHEGESDGSGNAGEITRAAPGRIEAGESHSHGEGRPEARREASTEAGD